MEGCSNRAQKAHSFEGTHILDSKVTLTYHERNDAGWERGKGKKEKHISRGRKVVEFVCFIGFH